MTQMDDEVSGGGLSYALPHWDTCATSHGMVRMQGPTQAMAGRKGEERRASVHAAASYALPHRVLPAMGHGGMGPTAGRKAEEASVHAGNRHRTS